jgi:hypothetical protein
MPQFAKTEADLEAIYGPRDTPVATIKEIGHISDHYRMFIDASPFVDNGRAGRSRLHPEGRPSRLRAGCGQAYAHAAGPTWQ